MPHMTMNIKIENNPATNAKTVDGVAIAMNKYFSHHRPHLLAIPRMFLLSELSGAFFQDRGAQGSFKAQIIVVNLNEDGEWKMDQYKTVVHSLYTTLSEAAVDAPPEYLAKDPTYAGRRIRHALVSSEGLSIGSARYDVPSTVKPFEIPEATDEQIDEYYKETSPRNKHFSRTKYIEDSGDMELISDESKMGTVMECGVAEGITTLFREQPDHHLFAKLEKGIRYMALDTDRIRKRWWNKGAWTTVVSTRKWTTKSGHEGETTRNKGDEYERYIQDTLGIDIIMIPVSDFKKKTNPINEEALVNGKYLTFQTKCSAFALCGHKSYFVEVECRNNADYTTSPSGLYKTIADWYGYITTAQVVAWLPTEVFKTILPGTRKHEATVYNDGYSKISMGHLVECHSVLLHPSVCTTAMPKPYADAFSKIRRRGPSHFSDTQWQERLSPEERDRGLIKRAGDLAQDWSLEECKMFFKNTLPLSLFKVKSK